MSGGGKRNERVRASRGWLRYDVHASKIYEALRELRDVYLAGEGAERVHIPSGG